MNYLISTIDPVRCLHCYIANMYFVHFVLIVLYCNSAVSKTIYLQVDPPTEKEIVFMKRYGYLSEEQGLEYTYTAESVAEPVRKMQLFAGLPPTGILDAETRKLFKKRRCGVRDIPAKSPRQRRYAIVKGWNKSDITYRVRNGASTFDKEFVEERIEASLAIWAPHGGLTFSKTEGPADITVSFVTGDHGDGTPFDGPGTIVAHAFPPRNGAMHFDDDEIWGDNPYNNDNVTDFFAVAVHEIGHALGLLHSDIKASVMYPYYQTPVEKLDEDDILAMQKLYLNGQNQQAPDTSQFTLQSSTSVPEFTMASNEDEDYDEAPDLCFTNYNTIQVIQGKIYVFEEEWMWVLPNRKIIEAGYPKRYHEVFLGLPKHVTSIKAIYEMKNGHIRIFSNNRYWEFDANFRFVRRGKILEYGLPRRVLELSTVFLSNYNNKTYLISYEEFWRYDEQKNTMDRGYPKDMSAWRELPAPVDAAMIWKGDTYFFSGGRFWRFDNELVKINDYYPLPTAQIWFPCASNLEMNQYIVNEQP